MPVDSSRPRRCKALISYARADGAWLLHRLRRAIEEFAREHGYEIDLWWDKDQENISPGDNFLEVIKDAIDDSRFVIFILSPYAVRPGGVCLTELEHAETHGMRILPVVAANDYTGQLQPIPAGLDGAPPDPRKVRTDHEKIQAVRRLNSIDHVDFTDCWSRNEDGSRSSTPPDEGSPEAEFHFRAAFERLKPQLLHGLQGKPFNRRDRVLVEAVRNYERRWNRPEKSDLHPRPAVWAEIVRLATARRGLIVHGVPGVGKSGLIDWIAHAHRSQVYAMWRCERSSPATWDAADFVRYVALQLYDRAPGYKEAIDALPDARTFLLRPDETADAIEDPTSAFRQLVLVPLQTYGKPPAEPRYVLVDGLDEAPEFDDRRMTIPKLLRLCHDDFPGWLRLIATAQTHYVQSDETALFGDWTQLEIDSRDPGHRADLLAYVRNRFDDPTFADLLRSTGVDADAAADAVAKTADGNFLVAVWMLNTFSVDWEAHRKRILKAGDAEGNDALDPEKFRAWVADPPPVGDYVIARLERLFDDPKGPQWRSASRFLAALTIARRPLTDDELSKLTSLEGPAVRELRGKFAAILKTTQQKRKQDGKWVAHTDFFHNGVRKWLRIAGDYAVDESQGREDVSRVIKEELDRGRAPSLPYLREFGLQHLLADGRIELAVDVLKALVDEEEREETTIGLPAMVKDVFYAIERMREKDVERILKIEPHRLATLVKRGCAEIPALYPPARILFDHHLERWKELRQELVDSDDLLTRYTLGRAIADSYLKADPDDPRRTAILQEIDSCFDAAPGIPSNGDGIAAASAYNLRQWARYAWRFLMPQPKIGAEARNRLAEGMATLSASADYNDHMILWECLLEGALTGELLPKKISFATVDESFRVPRWPYLRLDMLEFAAQCESWRSSALPWLGDSPEIRREIEAVQARIRRAKSEIKALQARHPSLSDLGRPLAEWQAPAKLNADLRKTVDDLLPLPYSQVARYLSPFVLHPSWEVTETAASIAAMLCEFRAEMPKLIAEWASSPHWQARYAAVDTAFNSRNSPVGDEALRPLGALARDERLRVELQTHRMGEQAFDVLIDALYDDPVSRVQFIVAEDLFYLLDDYEMAFRGTLAPHPDDCEDHGFYRRVLRYETPIRYWLKTASDCTLLDEVFQFVQAVMKGRRAEDDEDSPGLLAAQPLLEEWLRGDVIRYLAVEPNWWELDREEWLARLKAVRDADL